MKMKIKYKAPYELKITDKGDWVDLRANENVMFDLSNYKMIDLGIAMELPKGFEAVMASRSSTFKNWGIILGNGIAVIDNSYSGNNDIWKYPAYLLRNFRSETKIYKGERICQFRIQPSQKATIFQKLRWLFTNKIEYVRVDSLKNIDRGGFGTTGRNQL